ncbi:unnamed protein product [Pedinophyceae sp. YPF-701]|nr:unnamed protein product [Pedinophyceae sp. YPF-701]
MAEEPSAAVAPPAAPGGPEAPTHGSTLLLQPEADDAPLGPNSGGPVFLLSDMRESTSYFLNPRPALAGSAAGSARSGRRKGAPGSPEQAASRPTTRHGERGGAAGTEATDPEGASHPPQKTTSRKRERLMQDIDSAAKGLANTLVGPKDPRSPRASVNPRRGGTAPGPLYATAPLDLSRGGPSRAGPRPARATRKKAPPAAFANADASSWPPKVSVEDDGEAGRGPAAGGQRPATQSGGITARGIHGARRGPFAEQDAGDGPARPATTNHAQRPETVAHDATGRTDLHVTIRGGGTPASRPYTAPPEEAETAHNNHAGNSAAPKEATVPEGGASGDGSEAKTGERNQSGSNRGDRTDGSGRDGERSAEAAERERAEADKKKRRQSAVKRRRTARRKRLPLAQKSRKDVGGDNSDGEASSGPDETSLLLSVAVPKPPMPTDEDYKHLARSMISVTGTEQLALMRARLNAVEQRAQARQRTLDELKAELTRWNGIEWESTNGPAAMQLQRLTKKLESVEHMMAMEVDRRRTVAHLLWRSTTEHATSRERTRKVEVELRQREHALKAVERETRIVEDQKVEMQDRAYRMAERVRYQQLEQETLVAQVEKEMEAEELEQHAYEALQAVKDDVRRRAAQERRPSARSAVRLAQQRMAEARTMELWDQHARIKQDFDVICNAVGESDIDKAVERACTELGTRKALSRDVEDAEHRKAALQALSTQLQSELEVEVTKALERQVPEARLRKPFIQPIRDAEQRLFENKQKLGACLQQVLRAKAALLHLADKLVNFSEQMGMQGPVGIGLSRSIKVVMDEVLAGTDDIEEEDDDVLLRGGDMSRYTSRAPSRGARGSMGSDDADEVAPSSPERLAAESSRRSVLSNPNSLRSITAGLRSPSFARRNDGAQELSASMPLPQRVPSRTGRPGGSFVYRDLSMIKEDEIPRALKAEPSRGALTTRGSRRQMPKTVSAKDLANQILAFATTKKIGGGPATGGRDAPSGAEPGFTAQPSPLRGGEYRPPVLDEDAARMDRARVREQRSRKRAAGMPPDVRPPRRDPGPAMYRRLESEIMSMVEVLGMAAQSLAHSPQVKGVLGKKTISSRIFEHAMEQGEVGLVLRPKGSRGQKAALARAAQEQAALALKARRKSRGGALRGPGMALMGREPGESTRAGGPLAGGARGPGRGFRDSDREESDEERIDPYALYTQPSANLRVDDARKTFFAQRAATMKKTAADPDQARHLRPSQTTTGRSAPVMGRTRSNTERTGTPGGTPLPVPPTVKE